MRKSGGAVAGVRERAHDAEGRPGAQRVEPRQRLPALDRVAVPPFAGGPCGRGLEGVAVEVSDPHPLLFNPPGELRELGKGEALEEGTLMELDRLLDVAPVEGGQEVPEIAAEHGGIQPDMVASSLDHVLAQVAARGVEGLVEGVPGPLSVALRPQVEEKLVARHPRIAPAGQDRPAARGSGGGRMLLGSARCRLRGPGGRAL